ncbi:MAG TPA: hypothetical protein VLD83_17795 [Candidatus Binatia bacterium]|nr:hypothetical protein [Candidatus Binatia bacterium]
MRNNTEPERVRANTAAEINWRIDQEIEKNVRLYSDKPPEEIARRIWQLEQEWDIERVLETTAASLSLTGIALSITADKRWVMLPVVVLSFLLLHAFQGWCPPVPVLRRLGVRTREEIDRELYALKALVGNFPRSSEELSAEAAFAATTE